MTFSLVRILFPNLPQKIVTLINTKLSKSTLSFLKLGLSCLFYYQKCIKTDIQYFLINI